MAVSTTLRRPEWNRRLYGTVNLTLASAAGVSTGTYLTIAGDTTVAVMRVLPNNVFACEVLGMPRGKARLIFRPGDTVASGNAPTIRSMVPSTAPHNVAVSVIIYGVGGYDAAPTVFVGATQLTPTFWCRDYVIVTFTAASILSAGTVQVKVQNSDGQQSATSPFTVT